MVLENPDKFISQKITEINLDFFDEDEEVFLCKNIEIFLSEASFFLNSSEKNLTLFDVSRYPLFKEIYEDFYNKTYYTIRSLKGIERIKLSLENSNSLPEKNLEKYEAFKDKFYQDNINLYFKDLDINKEVKNKMNGYLRSIYDCIGLLKTNAVNFFIPEKKRYIKKIPLTFVVKLLVFLKMKNINVVGDVSKIIQQLLRDLQVSILNFEMGLTISKKVSKKKTYESLETRAVKIKPQETKKIKKRKNNR